MAKSILQFLLIFFIVILPLNAEENSKNPYEILAFLPRDEGMPQEKKTITFIADLARELKLPVNISSVSPANEQAFSYSKNIEIFLKGKSKDEILYLVPLNQSNAALLPVLLLMQDLAKQDSPPKIGARFVFLGAEKGESDAYPMGSKAFLQTYSPDRKAVFFYFDFDYPTNSPYLWMTDEMPPALWPLQQAQKLLQTADIKAKIPAFSAIISRVGFTSGRIIPLYFSENLSGVRLTSQQKKTIYDSTLSTEAWSEQVKNAFLNWHLNLEEIDANPEKNYINIGDLIIPEPLYITILIIFCAVLSSIFYSAKKSFFLSYQYFWKHRRDFILVFIITFLSFFLSGLISLSVLVLKNNQELWHQNPSIFLFYKVFLFFPIYFVFLQFLRDINLTTIQRSSIRMGLILSINNAVILLFINVTFIWPILWSIFCLLIALIFPRSPVKPWVLAASPIFTCLELYPIFMTTPREFSGFFLFDNLSANFILTMIFFPGTLTILSLKFKNPYLILKRNKALAFTGILIFILVTDNVFNQHFYKKNEQPLNIKFVENLNLDSAYIELDSPYHMESFKLLLYGQKYNIENALRSLQLQSNVEHSLDIKYKITEFYEVNSLEISIHSSENINSYDINISSRDDLVITNSNFPVQTVKREGRLSNFSILTGKNPPNPLVIKLATNPGKEIIIHTTGRIESNEEAITTIPERFKIKANVEITKEVRIDGI